MEVACDALMQPSWNDLKDANRTIQCNSIWDTSKARLVAAQAVTRRLGKTKNDNPLVSLVIVFVEITKSIFSYIFQEFEVSEMLQNIVSRKAGHGVIDGMTVCSPDTGSRRDLHVGLCYSNSDFCGRIVETFTIV